MKRPVFDNDRDIIYNAIMPRQTRIILKNIPHHISQRGNRRQDVFFSVDDRKRYLEWLTQYSNRYKFEILAYCLMSNHIHIVGIPREKTSIGRTMQIVNMRHTRAVNKVKGWNGHLWHSRYFSTALDETHFYLAMRYVEQNPVRAGMVMRAVDYPWSSAACHCGLRSDPVLTELPEYKDIFNGWSVALEEVPGIEDVERLKRRTYTGIPCGGKKFMMESSRIVGRKLKERSLRRESKTGLHDQY